MATASEATSALGKHSRDLPPAAVIFGTSGVMEVIREKLDKVAGANVPVLIMGETGTGKEVIARLIHQLSPWEDGPFVKVNCPAIPGTLLESELFGYEKGAFTGAYGTKPGRVELAHRGTLFLDEISELELSLQAKLLQLLQDGQFCRIGAQEDKRVEARVICATNRQLEEEIEAGTFREDLFYRINVLNLKLPALRERREDIPLLVDYFLGHYNTMHNCAAPSPSGQVMRLLEQYEWPGNIRQLENLVKRYVILGVESAITSQLVERRTNGISFKPPIPPNGSVSLKKLTRQAVLELERKIILDVLQANRWNRKRTARALEISYRALLYKIRQAGLPSKRARGPSLPGNEPSTVAV